MEEKPNEKAKRPQKDLRDSYRRSFLLRLWRTDQLGSFHWQASLEIPETGQRIGFASLEELFGYLMDLKTT